ncbi:MAG TPA: double-strand break repair helicase AddA [Candidatus Sulfotelmatobacter sp.]|nr:double-strand break repair helicase AddA [Candidatus Sulfotelmatobacter sp.]
MSAAFAESRRRQQSAADPTRSVWVSANAGAGKTHVLVDRALRLMLAGTRPEAILCLTFTKAAAAEMANRLHRVLSEWATADDVALGEKLRDLTGRPAAKSALAPARRLFAETLDAPGGLRIQTIHAFCQSLLGRFPLEAGVPPHFQVMDERSARELAEAARGDLLIEAARADGGDLAVALDRIVPLVDEAAFAELMQTLVGQRGRLRVILRHHGDDVARVIEATRAALGLGPDETVPQLLAQAGEDANFAAADLARAAAALDGGGKSDRERAAVIRAWLADRPMRAANFESPYMSAYLTQKLEPRATLITQAGRKADEGAAAILLAEQSRLLAVLQKLRAARIAGATAALWHIGAALILRYEAAKARAALLDYDDLILRTRDLLQKEGTAPWVLYKLDGGIDHILVDEAQDSSPEQWSVIAKLAEEFFSGAGAREADRTIFAVGDEKQSIYSFQGADPAAFAAMRRHFAGRVTAAATFQTIELALSFRSTAPVLAAVDAVFGRAEAAAGVSGAARVQHVLHRVGAAGLVELWPTEKPAPAADPDPWDAPLDQVAEDSPMARLARRIADTIAAWLRDGERLPSAGRPIRPGDVLVLVRRRNAFVEQMVRELKKRGIPVAGADRMVLTEQLAVMDLIALGRFVLLPDDELNLATVLKGPLFGFDDTLLYELAYGRDGGLWTVLQRRRAERAEFAAACDELVALRARADYTPPYEFYAELLGERGGRRRLLARLGREADDPVDEFLNLALTYQRAHAPSLEGFLHWLQAGETEVKRDMEQGRDEVRVMTVHGAKGLEANIVFLPDTCTVPDGRLDSRLLWQPDGDPPLFFWPVRTANDDATVASARRHARVRRLEEYRRLLYVAMTRARDRLYVCGFEGKTARPVDCWYELVRVALEPLAEKIPRDEESCLLRLQSPQTAPPQQDAAAPVDDAAVFALPGWARRAMPTEPSPPQPLVPSRPEAEEPAVRSPLGTDDGRRFRRGRLIHRLLQSLPDLPAGERAAAAARFLARDDHALDDAAQKAIAAEVLRLIEHPALAPLFGPGSRAEVPIAGLVGNHAVSGQIDRLVVCADKVLLVDFKSHRPAPDRLADVPSIYLKQMAYYRSALAGIYPGHVIESFIIWTEEPRIMQLKVDDLTALVP